MSGISGRASADTCSDRMRNAFGGMRQSSRHEIEAFSCCMLIGEFANVEHMHCP